MIIAVALRSVKGSSRQRAFCDGNGTMGQYLGADLLTYDNSLDLLFAPGLGLLSLDDLLLELTVWVIVALDSVAYSG